MDSDLYPDVMAARSLSDLLERTATGLGVDLVTVPDEQGPLTEARIASSVSGLIGEATTAAHAVTLAIAHLPADLGPAVSRAAAADQ
ncbi:DUF6193 family natural product biosynthesis protein [Kitasatospora sp. NPDC058965]|uniref:DUF6193 family natural product biosynthesis protein n=1 Tax=Kitasatospora sp. NPDC058965 TaxID=3346682 RepID=UPI0036D1DF90